MWGGLRSCGTAEPIPLVSSTLNAFYPLWGNRREVVGLRPQFRMFGSVSV